MRTSNRNNAYTHDGNGRMRSQETHEEGRGGQL